MKRFAMRRPPFRRLRTRHRSPPGHAGSATGPVRRLKPLRNVLLVLVTLSLFQAVTRGEVTWHREVLTRLREMAGTGTTRPSSGWGVAVKGLEATGARKEGNPRPGFDLEGRVTGILDGDSIIVLDGAGKEYSIRLFGIDAPERGQPHAATARRFLATRVARRSVGVVVQGRDRYGRWVGTVYLEDTNINLLMVQGGHAWWYRHYAPHDHLLEAAEAEARVRRAGLWSAASPVPPWQWRRVK